MLTCSPSRFSQIYQYLPFLDCLTREVLSYCHQQIPPKYKANFGILNHDFVIFDYANICFPNNFSFNIIQFFHTMHCSNSFLSHNSSNFFSTSLLTKLYVQSLFHFPFISQKVQQQKQTKNKKEIQQTQSTCVFVIRAVITEEVPNYNL